MWSLDTSVIRVGLSQQAVSIGKVSLMGWGSVDRVEHLACSAPSAGAEPWRAAVDRLAQWLEAHKGTRHGVQVVLSGRFVRWQLLPWRLELSGQSELAVYAALRFRETYGKAAQGWNILPAVMAPGLNVPAAAVDSALIEALTATCATHGARLRQLSAYFASAFDAWRGQLKGRSVWFGTVESDALTLGLLQDGQWVALQTQKLSGDWREPLQALMLQMGMACDVPVAQVPLYLAGDMPPPTFASVGKGTGQQPFTWLSPRQKSMAAAPGLRLALGR